MEPPYTVINTDKRIMFITITSSFILITIFSTLFFLPPIGTIFGVTIDLLILILVYYILSSKLIVSEEELSKLTFTQTTAIKFDLIKSIKQIKVIGVVSESPILVRSIIFEMEDNTQIKLSTFQFPYNAVMDILQQILEKTKDSNSE